MQQPTRLQAYDAGTLLRQSGLPLTILILSLVLHIWHIGSEGWGTGLQSPYPVSDASIYLHKAWYQAFIDPAGGFTAQIVYFSPYVQVMKWAYLLTGPYPWVPFAVNAVLMSLACVFIALTSRRIFTEMEGWLAGLLAVFCGIIIFFAGLTVKTNLVLCLLSAGLYFLASYFANRSWPVLFLALLSLGIASLDRYHLVFSVLLAIIMVLHQNWLDRKRLMLSTTVMSLAIIIVLMLSGWKFGQPEQKFFSPVGLNYYIGNASHSTGSYSNVPGVRDDIIGHRIHAQQIAEQDVGRRLTRWEMSQYWFAKSIDYLRDDPIGFFQLQWRKLGLLFAQGNQGQPEQYRVWRWHRPALAVAVIDMGIVISLAIIGGVLLIRRGMPLMVRYLMLSCLAFSLSMVIFFIHERYKMSLLPFLLPVAGFALAVILRQKNRRNIIQYLAIFLGLYASTIFLNQLNVYGSGWSKDVSSYREHMQRRFKQEQVVHTLKQQVLLNPTGKAWSRLSHIFSDRGFMPDAEVFARRAVQLEPNTVYGYEALYNIVETYHDENLRKELLAMLGSVNFSGRHHQGRVEMLKRRILNTADQ